MALSRAVWCKAARSNNSGDACGEVADMSNVVALRDSKDPDGPILLVSRADFGHLAQTLKNT
ncbi:DUF397 domain-containing protein [Actinomadura sp. GTD37]|uniref:DUF397 domain-containing protein n=1 Tax=Actinomadura sp. GTD37 TaxID=1778030 RepID=UPI0035C1450D